MTYTMEWLQDFDGEIDILNIDMSCLANTLEKYVSQYEYYYQTNLEKYPEIILSVSLLNHFPICLLKIS